MNRKLLFAMLGFAVLLLPLHAKAQVVALDRGMQLDEKRNGWLPYLFATDSLETGVGVAAFSGGNLQPQTSVFASAFIGPDGPVAALMLRSSAVSVVPSPT